MAELAGKRYDQCDASCTVDCGHCKGQGPPWLSAPVGSLLRDWSVTAMSTVAGKLTPEQYKTWTEVLWGPRTRWQRVREHVYLEPRDVWVGYYRGDRHHYVCLLPCVVIRWARR